VCYKRQFQRQKCKDAALHACGSERTKRNQCDFQQLYRALEERGRCDRLSAGRSHRLIFHQLRTRLSEFGCWKCDQLPRDRVKCEHDLLLPSASLQWVCYKPQFQRQKCNDEALHTCGAERTKRNQCDFEQLYRELAQRKRCNRLSVGRSHRLVFHQLRISEFGRRKHDQLPRDRVKCAYDLLLPSASLQWVCSKPQFQRQKCNDELRLSSCSRFSACRAGAARSRVSDAIIDVALQRHR
jgi:hypothetical protein